MGGRIFCGLWLCAKTKTAYASFHRAKSESPHWLAANIDWIELDSGVQMTVLRTDGGAGEFINPSMAELLASRGIRHERTSPGSSFQNGAVERLIRTIKTWAGASLSASGLSFSFWADAVAYAIYVYNRLPTASAPSPYERSHGHPPSLRLLHPFGCLVFSRIAQPSKRRLDTRARKAVYLGPARGTKDGHKVLHLDSRHVAITRDANFFDGVFPLRTLLPDGTLPPLAASGFFPAASVPGAVPAPHPSSVVPARLLSALPPAGRQEEKVQDPEELPPRARVPAPPPFNSADFARQVEADANVAAAPGLQEEPSSLRAAIATPQRKQWLEATRSELSSHKKNATWTVVDSLPRGRSAIPARWIFKVKKDKAGKVVRYKARLVAKGFRQRAGVDYNETFAPTLRSTTLRLLLAWALRFDLPVHQLDVVTAFLISRLDREIYMLLPEQDLINQHVPAYASSRLVRLDKALYGLVNSPRLWYQHISRTLGDLGFVQSSADPCLWVRPPASGSSSAAPRGMAAIAVFVDDCAVAAPAGEIDDLKAQLLRRYEMTDGGPISWFLGVSILRDSSSFRLSQTAAINTLLSQYSMTECRGVSTPAESVLSNVPASGEPPLGEDAVFWATRPYRALVGSLLYLLFTRPDIAFAVNQLTRFLASPSRACWAAAIRVLRYLNTTADLELVYRREEEMIESPAEVDIFSDADFAGDRTSRRSCTGNVAMFCNGAISWRSKLQRSVTLSTCEAELVALAAATQEAIWLQKLLRDLFIDHRAFTLFEDNAAAIALIRDARFSERTKHVEIKYFFLREQVASGNLNLEYVETAQNIADIFTKPLGRTVFERLRALLGLLEPKPDSGQGSSKDHQKKR
jgi:hypothetical protein